MRGKLTNARIKALKEAGRYGDGNTLYLNVAPSGSKQWVQRLTIKGRQHDMGLGGWPIVTLAEAREAAFDNRRLARKGGDPLADKRRAKVPTFKDAAYAVYAVNLPRWRDGAKGKTARNWLQQLQRHAFPRLGHKPIDRIGREDVLAILTPIWTSTPRVARNVRQRIRLILEWGQAHGFVEHNAAGEMINGALPAIPSVKAHHRSLPHEDVASALEAINAIEASSASETARLCFRFVVLTACRSGEARGALWSEIDMDARTWVIPAERMKAGQEHRVPLSDAAVKILEAASDYRDKSDLVFPSPRKRMTGMSDNYLNGLLKTVGLADKCVVHGFRSTFRDWCADTGKPREIAEAALAHTVKGVEGAYFRSDMFQRRRELMDAWARYAVPGEAGEADVIQLHG